jgi:hypothetical protein
MKTHQVTISSKFVGNIKRMWDSSFAAYKELIQNALRAGASTIRVTYQDNVLTVEDDGEGFEDLASLLTIGESGWSDNVVEPAGVGIYAAPAFADRVTIQSGKRVLVLAADVFETGVVKEEQSSEDIRGTRVIVEGIKLDITNADMLRGYGEVDFYINGELIPNPLEKADYIEIPYGRLYLKHHSETSGWLYGLYDKVVWEGYKLEDRFISLPGIWVVDTKSVPGELRPQLPHRDRLIRNEVYDQVIDEIREYFNDWALDQLRGVNIKKLPLGGKYEKIATKLENDVAREQIPAALVIKARDEFYTGLKVPRLYEPVIDWDGAFGFVTDLETDTVYVRNDRLVRVTVPFPQTQRFLSKLINAQTQEPLSIVKNEKTKAKYADLQPVNLRKEDGGWYCDGWELDGGHLVGLDLMIWPTPEGNRIVHKGNPSCVAKHVITNAELWSLALVAIMDDNLSSYWGEGSSGFDVLPGEVLVDVYREMGREARDAITYVKLEQAKSVLTGYGLPDEYQKIARENLETMEEAFCAAGYVPPENAGRIHTFI